MNRFLRQFSFDSDDAALARLAAELVEGGAARSRGPDPVLHPRGIVELAESQTTRLVRSMRDLLEEFDREANTMRRRLRALRVLRDEVMDGLDAPFRLNTARVVLELLKRLLRSGDEPARCECAHDLRSAMSGNPLFIRKLLKRFNLVELPEKFRSVTFDYHVHDANTKGRKSPAHLIMDAWIKGVYTLEVIYYNYVPRQAAEELLRAAGILGIEVRIGVEFRVRSRGRFVDMIWCPRGFAGTSGYLRFLDRVKKESFTYKCLQAANFRKRLVLALLHGFNRGAGRKKFNRNFQIALPEISDRELLDSVHYGQPSIEHIGELLAHKLAELRRNASDIPMPEELASRYLDLELWRKTDSDEHLPELCRMTPAELCAELHKISAEYDLTLNLSSLEFPEIVALLYDCAGDISHLEIFNIKDTLAGTPRCDREVNDLRHALNAGRAVELKNMLRRAIGDARRKGMDDLQLVLHKILHDLPRFSALYAQTPLRATIGSDSAGRQSAHPHGMGFLVTDTLPWHLRRALERRKPALLKLPFRAALRKIVTLNASGNRQLAWECVDPAERVGGKADIAALGSIAPGSIHSRQAWRLNSSVKIILKIALGFTAAFVSFYLTTPDSGFLMYFGAAIWLGITLVRNVIQAVLAAGKFRGSMRNWKNFISYQRIADSLMYTGLSVPLLDYVIKNLLLRQLCGLTVEDNPLAVFAGIAVANGLYITVHNLLRAFPRSAVWGNWLRAPLSIPLAMLYNTLLGGLMHLFGAGDAAGLLQDSAAILSKLASDTVGGVIEAVSDRKRYRAARREDFGVKLRELYDLSEKLEILLPEDNLLQRLEKGEALDKMDKVRNDKEFRRAFFINALDMMYLWMRQPQAPCVMKKLLADATEEERRLFLHAQKILRSERTVVKLFMKGLAGEHFRAALGFYLHTYRSYLDEVGRIAR